MEKKKKIGKIFLNKTVRNAYLMLFFLSYQNVLPGVHIFMQLLLVPCMISIANTNFGYDSESNLYCFNLSWHWEKYIEIILVPISNHKYNLYLFTVKLITEPLNHF